MGSALLKLLQGSGTGRTANAPTSWHLPPPEVNCEVLEICVPKRSCFDDEKVSSSSVKRFQRDSVATDMDTEVIPPMPLTPARLPPLDARSSLPMLELPLSVPGTASSSSPTSVERESTIDDKPEVDGKAEDVPESPPPKTESAISRRRGLSAMTLSDVLKGRRVHPERRGAKLPSFIRKKLNLDLEEFELQPPRYRPDRLETISKTTRFSKKEIQFVYRAFKQECPTGMITEDTFKSIYAKFFPLGDSSQYAHYVFCTLDRGKTGTITFGDFMLGLSVLVKGSLHERLKWAFSLYDVNDDGFVTREEMTDVITAIYDLMGVNTTTPCIEEDTPKDHVDRIFQKLDLNHDGVITVDEFIDYCSTNEDIRSSFAVFDDLW